MVLVIYNFFAPLLIGVLRLFSTTHVKLRQSFAGRKNLVERVSEHYASTNPASPRILIHVASLGELEQAKSVIAGIKSTYPLAHIHLTFFSPSGYENAIGKYVDPNFISYSPLDSRAHVTRFLNSTKPDLALFTRYDVWPNMAMELKRRGVPTILFAATATEGFIRRLPVIRNFYRSIFCSLTKILAVSEDDKSRFIEMGVSPSSVEVAGDTRFDQVVARRLQMEKSGEQLLPSHLRETLKTNGTLVFVVGSSWPSDEAMFLKTLELSVERKDNIITIIAPHELKESHISKLLGMFSKSAIRFSNIEKWAGEPLILVDSIGKLFGLYRYADVAMIGGGFGAGLHNVLEVATWGVPSIVGPKHTKSREVNALIDRIAAFEVKTKPEFNFVFWQLAESEDLRVSSGNRAAEFIQENIGATTRTLSEIAKTIKA